MNNPNLQLVNPVTFIRYLFQYLNFSFFFSRRIFFLPAAKMTREFPVSLINTFSVFQMLVSVIFVGKHFATTLTLVSVAV